MAQPGPSCVVADKPVCQAPKTRIDPKLPLVVPELGRQSGLFRPSLSVAIEQWSISEDSLAKV